MKNNSSSEEVDFGFTIMAFILSKIFFGIKIALIMYFIGR